MDDFLSQALSTNSTSPLIEDILPIEDVDTDSCQLLGPVALAVQGVMGVIVIGGLLIKRMRERPRRKWKIWLADVGKQVVGQLCVHFSNVAISDLIASNRSDNPCSLYALNILIDTTLGVLLLYFLLHYSTHLMQRFQPLYKTGFYGTPFSMSLWAEQAAVYVGCLAVMKIVVLVIFWIAPELEDGMSWGLSWIENEEAQVVLVMLILPLVMNLFQFLMVDSIIRSKDPASPSVVNQESDEEALRRGFLETGSDDDEDDANDEHQQRSGNAAQQRRGHEGYEDMAGGDEDETTGRQKQATELLFDADSPLVQQIPMMTMSHNNRGSSGPHAYPPTSASDLSSPLPPYSTLPPSQTSAPSAGGGTNQSYGDRMEESGKDDDGWGDQWDASSDIDEETELRHIPSPLTHPLALPSHSSPALEQSVRLPSTSPSSQPRTRSSSPPASRFFTPVESGTTTRQPSPSRDLSAESQDKLQQRPNVDTVEAKRELVRRPTENSAAEEQHEEEEADWGFSPPPVPAPELHVMPSTPSPRASGDFDWLSSPELDREPTKSTTPIRIDQQEKVGKIQAEEAEEEEEDLWGFDDSLSNDAPLSPIPSALPDSSNAVEKVLGLNEAIVEVAPQIRAPTEVGKELGGLS